MAHEMRIVHMQSLAGHRLAREQRPCRKWYPPPGRPGPLDALCADVKSVANEWESYLTRAEALRRK